MWKSLLLQLSAGSRWVNRYTCLVNCTWVAGGESMMRARFMPAFTKPTGGSKWYDMIGGISHWMLLSTFDFDVFTKFL
jgi:hypothetical protein